MGHENYPGLSKKFADVDSARFRPHHKTWTVRQCKNRGAARLATGFPCPVTFEVTNSETRVKNEITSYAATGIPAKETALSRIHNLTKVFSSFWIVKQSL